MDLKKIFVETLNGFLIAFMIDMNAWSKSTPKGQANAPFDWSLAGKRWAAGAGAGLFKAIGWDAQITFDAESARQALNFMTGHFAVLKCYALGLVWR